MLRRFKHRIHRVFRGAAPAFTFRRRPTGIYAQAEALAFEILGNTYDERILQEAFTQTREQAEKTNEPLDWLATLLLIAPRAAEAQYNMDKYPHGHQNKQTWLYTLIDFNDVFVATVLSMPLSELVHFPAETKRILDRMCKRAGKRTFSRKQYSAIVHGLSREIAVYVAVSRAGYDVCMTSRAEDAFGIDMVITDRKTSQSINVDCKTRSSFYFRLKDLHHEGRLSTAQIERAERDGYVEVINGHDGTKKRIILWRIDQNTYGSISNFSFERTTILLENLQRIMREHGGSYKDITGKNTIDF